MRPAQVAEGDVFMRVADDTEKAVIDLANRSIHAREQVTQQVRFDEATEACLVQPQTLILERCDVYREPAHGGPGGVAIFDLDARVKPTHAIVRTHDAMLAALVLTGRERVF